MINFRHSDIQLYYASFMRDMSNIQSFQLRDPNDVKIRAILNTDIYTKATRLLEASIKHIIYNCLIIKGLTEIELGELSSRLKRFNNPEYSKIKQLVLDELSLDIDSGLRPPNNAFSGRDKTNLDQIVLNRHRNVHASEDSTTWFSTNNKSLTDFNNEFEGLINILLFMDGITYDGTNFVFSFQTQTQPQNQT
ncbi:hypothetical protein P4555_24520 [Peribacillus frigoritolerans]|uniref:hypothetical protein n=1 Tax=Peribacillus frigoritolerans TaxID=450367 RepID=UPI002E2441F3|nr:hypothetical protein [Peribacillus frigoritolerans]